MLPIRRRCHFLLDAQMGCPALKCRSRIRHGGGYVTGIFIGHRAEPSKWSKEMERCLKNTTQGDQRTPASVINRDLQIAEECLESAFAFFEEQECLPKPEELKAKFSELVGDKLGMTIRPKGAEGNVKSGDRLLDLWDGYVENDRIRQGWSERHLANIRTVRMHINKYQPRTRLDDIDEKWIVGLVTFLSKSRGLKNTSIDKTLRRLLKRFLRWAKKAGHYSKDYQDFFDLRLKGTDSDRSDVYPSRGRS